MIGYAALALSTMLCACSPLVFSPPTGTIPIESSRTVGEDGVGVRGEVTTGGSLFGPTILTARASGSYGLSDQLDVDLSPALIWIGDSRQGDSHPGIYALRAGVKYARVKHVALTAGLGGGASAAGAFISPDIGTAIAFENPYLVPFADARLLFSAPLAARHVHFTTDDGAADGHDDDDDLPDRYRRRPRFSYGFQFALGLRLPLPWEREGATYRPSLQCAIGTTQLRDSKPQSEGYGMIGCGVEVLF